jgi:hypothetical protein
MKKMFMVFFAGIVFASCNNDSATSTEVKNDSSVSTTNSSPSPNYAYTIDHPDNWETGSSENTAVALNALKSFENGDVAKSMEYFGDSVHLLFDRMDVTVAKDSLQSMFKSMRASFKNIDIKMEDWESVISKDNNEEYVTLWYKQINEDMNGKKDSVDLINDLKLKNGKIIQLSEYTRKLH